MRGKNKANFVIENISITPREMETLHLIARGLTNKEIAKKLHISVSTVLNYLDNLTVKIVYKCDDTPKSTRRVILTRWYYETVIGVDLP